MISTDHFKIKKISEFRSWISSFTSYVRNNKKIKFRKKEKTLWIAI